MELIPKLSFKDRYSKSKNKEFCDNHGIKPATNIDWELLRRTPSIDYPMPEGGRLRLNPRSAK